MQCVCQKLLSGTVFTRSMSVSLSGSVLAIVKAMFNSERDPYNLIWIIPAKGERLIKEAALERSVASLHFDCDMMVYD